MKNVIIIGAGGHGKVVADIVRKSNDKLVGFLDSKRNEGTHVGVPILGYDYEYEKFNDCSFIVAVGNQASRKKIVDSMKNVDWYTAISNKAIISPYIKSLGKGTVIAHNAILNAGASVGNHCIINTGAVIEHDNIIRDFEHISVGSLIGGWVSIGENTMLGIGSVVKDHISITSNCLIGAGAVVVKDICKEGIYVGVPAQKI